MFDRRRVLIIDEDRRTVDRLQERFVRSGYEAEVALSGPVGLSILEDRRMDAAVLSARIGHSDDWAFVRKLKRSDRNLCVVLFDAPRVKGLSREARRAGVSRYLATPVDVEMVFIETAKTI